MFELSTIVANIESTRTYTIKKEKIESTLQIGKRMWQWSGIIRNSQTGIIVDFNVYFEEASAAPGGYKFTFCHVEDSNQPGRYFSIRPLVNTQDLWYVAAKDPAKLNYGSEKP